MTSRWRHHPERVTGPGLLQPLDEARCWILLHRGTVGRVGLGRTDGTALVVPVNYTVSGRSIFFRTGLGAIVDGLGDRASFEVDGTDDQHHIGWSVLVDGTVTVEAGRLPDVDLFGPEPWAVDRDRYLVRIAADHVSGRAIRHHSFDHDDRSYL